MVDVLLLARSTSLDSCGWKLDTGATQHICSYRQCFSTYLPFPAPKLLQVGKAQVFLSALGEGTITLRLLVPTGGQVAFTLTKVWYCPECPFNLLSSARIVRAGCAIRLTSAEAIIHAPDGHPTIFLEMEASGLYSCQPLDWPIGRPVSSSVVEGITAPVYSLPDPLGTGMSSRVDVSFLPCMCG